MGRRFNRDSGSIFRLAGNCPLWKRNTGQSRHTAYRTKHSNQRGKVVGSHIEHWATTNVVEKLRVSVPALWPMAHHKGRSAYGNTDSPIVYQFDTGLNPPTQESIRSTANAQASCLGMIEDLFPLLAVNRQGFLAIGRFPGLQSFD